MKSITFLCAFALCCLTTYQGISQVFSIRVSVRENSCSIFPTGRIDCDYIRGGVLPITWKISSGSGTRTGDFANFFYVAPGMHTITATDARGATATETVTVKEITISLSSYTPVTCHRGNDATIVLTSVNGTPLLGFNLFSSSNGSFSDYDGTFTGLFADDYTISSRECRITGSPLVKITQPPLVVNVTTPSVINVTCNGGNNGKIVVSASGGTGAITYDISPNSGTQSPAGTFNGLTAGNYAITAHDASTNCTTRFATVEQPTTALSATSTAGSIACNGGTTTVNVTATGGTAPYTGTGSFTKGAGTHIFTVTDANGCTQTISVTITEPTALTVTSSAGTIVCNGGTTIVVVSATGGTAPYLGTSSFLMGAGTYTFTVVDANACSKTTSITIPEPMALSATSTAGPIACNGGTTTINVNATGGTAPYTGTGSFTRGVGNYSFTITDANFCTKITSIAITQPTVLSATSTAGSIACNGGTTTVNVAATGGTAPYSGTGSFTKSAGTYSFTVTDANGCAKTTSVTITEPTALTATSSAGTIACNGGSTTVNVNATGGTAPYTGTGSFTKSAGTYSFAVTDANGCAKTTSVTITEPTALTVTSSTGTIACNSGTTTVNVAATGGTAPYTGTGNFTRGVGNYSFTVTDANGCSKTTSVTITEPTALSATSSAGTIACKGGTTTINVNATGGTAPYTGTGSFTKSAGTYSFTVTDANGCTKTTSVSITEPTAVTVNAGSCQYVYYGYGSNCTNLTATASGGGGTFTYKWSPGNLSGATVNVCPTSTTTYTVTATDQNGCKGTNTVKVEVIDVRCEKNKVKVCHSGMTLCVDKIAVPDHLAHGDKLGTCGTTACGMSLRSNVANLSRAVIKQESTSSMTLQVYPNPIEDAFKIQLEHTIEGSFNFELYNISGKMVKQEKQELKSGYNEVRMDIYDLPAGLYILRAKGSNSRQMAVKINKL